MKLYCDNKAAISIANNHVQQDRTRHAEFGTLYKREIGQGKHPYIPSCQQVGDVLTKGFLKPSFYSCVSRLGLIDVYEAT